MLPEIISLLNAVLGLFERKATLDRKYFEDFVQPAWEAFAKVHDDYIQSLDKYRDIISDQGQSVEELIKIIKKDFVITKSLRSELEAVAKNLPLNHFHEESKVGRFIRAIELYLNRRLSFSVETEQQEPQTNLRMSYKPLNQEEATQPGSVSYAPLEQWVRRPLIAYLSRRASATNRTQAVRVIESFAIDLQNKYGDVADAYYELKKGLLS